MELAFITWNISPEFLHISERVIIRYYGLFWSLGLLVGYFLLHALAKREQYPSLVADKEALYATIGVLIGARLGHCLIYDPVHYLSNPLELLHFWEGGLASHGGGVGVLLALALLARRLRVPFLWIMDRIAIPIAFIATMIRLGNLMNSEIYGVETTRPWGFIFTRAGETLPHHPTQLYEASGYFLVFILLAFLYYRRPTLRRYRGLLFSIFLVLMFTVRFLVEFIKEPQSAYEVGMFLNMGQLLSIPFLLYGGYLFVQQLRHGPYEKVKITLSTPKKKRK